VAELRVRTLIAGLAAARQLGTWGAISLGLDFGYGWKDLNVGSSSPQDDEFSIGEFFARLNYDTLDNLFFPKSGAKAEVEFRRSTEALGAEETFNNVSSQLLVARTWDRNTILIGGSAGVTFGGDAPTQNLFELGGLFNLSGFETNELSGQNFAIGRLIAYRNIGAQTGLFDLPIYLGASLEAGNVWNDRGDMSLDDLILAASGFAGVDTPLGPIYLAYGYAEGGNDSVYLFLGQTF
ncbi:MAG: BamA/TamA family outer membrane protein, partial [Gammaproteobacteria bacterium]